MKNLVIELPPNRDKERSPVQEATLTFIGAGETEPIREVFKVRLDHGSVRINFFDRENVFSWGGPNQCVLSVVITDDPHRDRAHAELEDSIGLSVLNITISAKANRYDIMFPEIYNWIQVDDWAIPIP